MPVRDGFLLRAGARAQRPGSQPPYRGEPRYLTFTIAPSGGEARDGHVGRIDRRGHRGRRKDLAAAGIEGRRGTDDDERAAAVDEVRSADGDGKSAAPAVHARGRVAADRGLV